MRARQFLIKGLKHLCTKTRQHPDIALVIHWVLVLMAALPVGPVFAQGTDTPKSQKRVDFGRDVLPIFQNHCFSCHGPDQQQSNFRLNVKSLALAVGDFGEPPIVPGDSAASPLIQFVSGTDDPQMPPDGEGKALGAKQVDLLRRWVDEGADWPEEFANENSIKLTTDHWSFQPLRPVPIPEFDEGTPKYFRTENPIDRFVARRLREHGLSPSEPADRRTLIRRLTLDMHGLLPRPGQIDDFIEDRSDVSWSKLIEDSLASPHYGERWARHWLDVVRFGESTGFEVNRDRANAWYYRDYVIDSFNTDKSYQDFIVEQLAGDAVGVDEATGFLVGGAHDIVKSPDINLTLMQREDELADYVNTTSTTFLGLTVGCARCHNHKFDPILQSDYYSMQAVFAGVQHGERKIRNRMEPAISDALKTARQELIAVRDQLQELKSNAPPAELNRFPMPMVNARKNIDNFEPQIARFVRFNILKTNSVEPCLDELQVFSVEGRNVGSAAAGGKATSSGDYQGNPKHRLEHINDDKFGNDRSWISNSKDKSWVQIELAELSTIDRVVWGRDRVGGLTDRLATGYSISISENGMDWREVSSSSNRPPFLVNGKEAADEFVKRLNSTEQATARSLLQQRDSLTAKVQQLENSIPTGYVGTFKKPKEIRRLYRGDPMAPRELVNPDTLKIAGSLGLDNSTAEQQRRLKFAKWIASEENPFTARVIVNRVWQYHFGRGLVATASDFGKAGALPSHPELLDWLASEFMANGWSLKWLHRQILTSATYQQSSRPRVDALAKDAAAQWLWRFPPRRLEAEAIRDCVLQVSGKLNLKAGGPGFLLFHVDRENVHHYFPLEKFEPEHFRRMVYMTKIRQEQDEVFGVFDCPDGGQAISKRTSSTTALQALNLLNSKFLLEQAALLAERLQAESDQVREQIKLAYRLAYGRLPDDQELQDVEAFVGQYGLAAFCRVLLNTNEFLFLS